GKQLYSVYGGATGLLLFNGDHNSRRPGPVYATATKFLEPLMSLPPKARRPVVTVPLNNLRTPWEPPCGCRSVHGLWMLDAMFCSSAGGHGSCMASGKAEGGTFSRGDPDAALSARGGLSKASAPAPRRSRRAAERRPGRGEQYAWAFPATPGRNRPDRASAGENSMFEAAPPAAEGPLGRPSGRVAHGGLSARPRWHRRRG
ncbi:unnamed protein product, partial [Prorocentrum cordatum]